MAFVHPYVPDDHHFSPTSLETYVKCPLQYKFKHVLKIPSKQYLVFAFGSFVHDVIHFLELEELQGKPTTEWSALNALDKLWPTSAAFQSNLAERQLRGRASEIMMKYAAWNEANENTLIDAEVGFLFALNDRNVKGYIDRVERTESGEYSSNRF